MQNKQSGMQEISNELLLETYWTAVKLGLDQGFIEILKAELARRGIHVIAESE